MESRAERQCYQGLSEPLELPLSFATCEPTPVCASVFMDAFGPYETEFRLKLVQPTAGAGLVGSLSQRTRRG